MTVFELCSCCKACGISTKMKREGGALPFVCIHSTVAYWKKPKNFLNWLSLQRRRRRWSTGLNSRQSFAKKNQLSNSSEISQCPAARRILIDCVVTYVTTSTSLQRGSINTRFMIQNRPVKIFVWEKTNHLPSPNIWANTYFSQVFLVQKTSNLAKHKVLVFL